MSLRDLFSRPPKSPVEESAAELVEALQDEAVERSMSYDVSKFRATEAILDSDRSIQAEVLVQAATALVVGARRQSRRILSSKSPEYYRVGALQAVYPLLTKRKLSLSSRQAQALGESMASDVAFQWGMVSASAVKQIEVHVAEEGFSPALKRSMESLRKRFRPAAEAVYRKLARRVEHLLKDDDGTEFEPVRPGDAWADSLLAILEGETPERRALWERIVTYARSATASKPSKKWLAGAAPLVEAVGAERYASVMQELLATVGTVGSRNKRVTRGWSVLEPTMIDDAQADLFRGLIWASVKAPSDALFAALGGAAEAAYKKIPDVGPRAPKIGNACVHTLALAEQRRAVAEISRVRAKVKHGSIQKQLDKALTAAANQLGITAAELEEQATPSFDMDPVGIYREVVGAYRAEIAVADSASVTLSWIKPDGKPQKSVPKQVKDDAPETVKALKRRVKEIQQMLPAVCARLERQLVEPRHHSLRDFRAHYLDHPLVGTLARRLIWSFDSGDERTLGAFSDGEIKGDDERPIGALAEDTRVSLWHPIGSAPEEVLRWRERLGRCETTQPFKQAHREVYLVTDAERETGTYSNRFAAHVLRQHQFHALCRQRGWRYTLQGQWDSHNTPSLELPQWNLAAELGADGIDNTDWVSDAGIWNYVSTDQVRFYELTSSDDADRDWRGLPRADHPMRMSEVPALAFSEVMRDVDLFVGVCSVGNDPNWADSGEVGGYANYWSTYSFGELSVSAETRREVLRALIPKLKIADRCSFDDKFLVVRGSLRTYKIHLGSSNILMTPNDQYLCIVPDRRLRAHAILLPFEGDTRLDAILSKALLLAADEKIEDPVITSQIRR